MKRKVKPSPPANALHKAAMETLQNRWLYLSSAKPKAAAVVAQRLVYAPPMREVWQQLEPRAPSDFTPRELLAGCIHLLDLWYFSPRLKPAEHRQRYLRLAEQAEGLLGVLKHDREFWEGAPAAALDDDGLIRGLSKFAEHARAIAERPLSRKPNQDGAVVAYFARSVSAYFVRVFGAPFDGAVATMASVLFDRDVTRGFVKNLRQRRARR